MGGITSCLSKPASVPGYFFDKASGKAAGYGIYDCLRVLDFGKAHEYIDRSSKKTLDKPLMERVSKGAPALRLIHLSVARIEIAVSQSDRYPQYDVEMYFYLHDDHKEEMKEIMKKLIDKKVNLSFQDDRGLAPIYYAVMQHFPDECEMLLQTGASLFVKGGDNRLVFDKLLECRNDIAMENTVENYCIFNLRNLAARAFLERCKTMEQEQLHSFIEKLGIPPRESANKS